MTAPAWPAVPGLLVPGQATPGTVTPGPVIPDSDTGHGTDAGEAITVTLSDSDHCTGGDGRFFIIRGVTQDNADGTSSEAALMPPVPVGTTNGDFLLVSACWAGSAITLTDPPGWTLLDKTLQTNDHLAVYYKKANGTLSDAVTLTFSAACACIGSMAAVGGWDGNPPVHVNKLGGSASITATFPGIQPVTSSDLLIYATGLRPTGSTVQVSIVAPAGGTGGPVVIQQDGCTAISGVSNAEQAIITQQLTAITAVPQETVTVSTTISSNIEAVCIAPSGEIVDASDASGDASGAAVDDTEDIALADADAGHGTDAAERVGAGDSDLSTAAETSARLVSDTDPCTGLDAGEAVQTVISSSDASGAAAESATIDPPDSDLVTGTDSGAPNNSTIIDSDSCHALDAGESGTGSTPIVDSDACHGVDSGFSFFSASDTAHGTDAEKPFRQPDSDAVTGTDDAQIRWPSDSDHSTAASTEIFSGTLLLSDSDTAHSAEDGPPPPIPNIPVSDSDAGTGTETHIIDIWTNQPPFRWNGGQYELVYEGHRVWSGLRPDREALRLSAILETGGRVVKDSDWSHTAESESRPIGVTLIVSHALQVALEVRAE